MRVSLSLLFLSLLIALPSTAHEVRPALLNVTEVTEGTFLVRWKVPAMGTQRVAIDPVFDSACVVPSDPVDGIIGGAFVSSWNITCSDGLADTRIQFSNLPSTMIDVLVQVSFLDGRYYSGLVRPNDPVFQIPDKDSQTSVFASYLFLGVEHILLGWDHLLFVLGLVMLVTNAKRLLWAVTGFTLAHSLTLALAMFEIVQIPGPPVEAAIALSIVFLAVEGINYRKHGTESLAIRSPWAVSMAIGLVHGLGFAGALSEYGLPPYAKFVSLLAFNLGVEIGQLAFIAALLVVAIALRKANERLLVPVQTFAMWAIGTCGSFWLVERITGFFA